MSFGRDYRLVGEATVTGEKYRAGTTFWAALAHTDIIGKIKRMVEHYAIVGEFIDKPLVYDPAELIAWLTKRSSNCLMCYPYFVPNQVESTSTNDHQRFNAEFILKMKEIGLGWREFQLYYDNWLKPYLLAHPNDADCWPKEKILRWQPCPDSIFRECITPEYFVEVLDKIATNRRRLFELPAVK